MSDYMKEAERLPELHRETVDDALEVVDTFGPWGMDINEDLRRQIVLADEVRQLRKLYSAAIKGRQEMRSALRDTRAALLAHIQRGVPGGYDIAPAFRGYAKLGSGHYVLHNCPRTDEDHPSLVIAIATEAEKSGRQIGELGQSQPGLMIQPERIAVRIDFKSVAALDALEQQLRFLREDSFPDSLTKVPAVPAPAEVPMPEPDVTTLYSYTDSTGEPRNLAHTHDQMRTYGATCRAAGEAAGYARGLAEAGDRIRRGREILDAALRGEVKP